MIIMDLYTGPFNASMDISVFDNNQRLLFSGEVGDLCFKGLKKILQNKK